MSRTIGVFPAAGGLGTATLEQLLKTVEPSRVVLISRHPEKLQEEIKLGATPRKADYDDPASFDGAFEAVDILNIISYPSFVKDHR